MSKRFLAGTYTINVKNGSLNGSSADAEGVNVNGKNNKTFVKKVGFGSNSIPYASATWIKYNIKKLSEDFGQKISTVILKEGTDKQQLVVEGNPFKNFDEDLFGFMTPGKEELTEEEYNTLSKETQGLYKKETKKKEVKYTRNITKKRKAVAQFSTLQAIGTKTIKNEFGTRVTNSNNVIFTKEIYSSIMSATFNVDINRLGKFLVSPDESGFRDYSTEEVESLNLNTENINSNYIELTQEQKKERLNTFLDCIEYFNTDIRQTNNLEDLTPQFIILSEYSIGINPFLNIFKNGSLDINYLVETLESTNRFRVSKVFIGIKSGFLDEITINELKTAIDLIGLSNEVVITNVNKAFTLYKETL